MHEWNQEERRRMVVMEAWNIDLVRVWMDGSIGGDQIEDRRHCTRTGRCNNNVSEETADESVDAGGGS
jgi:hypothetical protein